MRRGAFYDSKPFIILDDVVYIGKENQYHIDLANEYGLFDNWEQKETYNGRLFEKNGKLHSYELNEVGITKTGAAKVDAALKRHYSESDDAPLVNGKTFSGAVASVARACPHRQQR